MSASSYNLGKSLSFVVAHKSPPECVINLLWARASSCQNHHCDLGSTSVMMLIYTMYNDAEEAAREVLLWKSLHWSLLAESLQYGIDVVEGLVNFGSYLRTCEDNFTRNEDE